MAKRKYSSTDNRRWTNFCQSTNDIAEIRMITKIKEHPAAHTVNLNRLFAVFYRPLKEGKKAMWSARSIAMFNMLVTLNTIAQASAFIQNGRQP